jgi:hypothetical protein
MLRIIRKTRAVLAAAIASALLLAGLAAPASAEVGYNVLFQNANSGKCLEVYGFSTANFAPTAQWDCHGGANQQWNYSTSTGLIQNVYSGKCLEVLYYSTANGATVGQYDCYGGANQQWYMNRSNGLIGNRYSGKCLEVYGYSTANGASVVQWDCHGGPNQVWWWR